MESSSEGRSNQPRLNQAGNSHASVLAHLLFVHRFSFPLFDRFEDRLLNQ